MEVAVVWDGWRFNASPSPALRGRLSRRESERVETPVLQHLNSCVVWPRALFGMPRCLASCVVWPGALFGPARHLAWRGI